MKPYYDDGARVIYHGDCREVDAWDVAGGFMVTDPPYGIAYESARHDGGNHARSIAGDADTSARDTVLSTWSPRPAIVFGAPKVCPPPGVLKATLVWHKPGSGMGDLSVPWKPDYEFVFILGSGFHGNRDTSVLSFPLRIYRGDLVHPHEKPVDLLRTLVAKCAPLAPIVDPFMGSGTTLRAAKDLGRRAIGVEIEERYCEIAAKRLAQEVLDFGGAA